MSSTTLPSLEPIDVIDAASAAHALASLRGERLRLEHELRMLDAAVADADRWASLANACDESRSRQLVEWWTASLLAAGRADIRRSIAAPAAEAACRRLVAVNRSATETRDAPAREEAPTQRADSDDPTFEQFWREHDATEPTLLQQHPLVLTAALFALAALLLRFLV